MKDYLKYRDLCIMLILFGSVSILKAEDVCGFGHMRCTLSRKCIPMSWKCDTDSDCTDNGIIDDSDELNCPAKTCADEEFTCNINGQCIPERWMCDGEPDCENGEDEREKLCMKSTCPDDKFSCGDHSCINMNHRCDGIEDCEKGLDEWNCTVTCDVDMFTCDDGQCISLSWSCDGDHDCLDESDEKDCGEIQCDADREFKCESQSQCIDIGWKCDGDFDCIGHSDELSCNFTAPGEQEICSPDSEFTCVTSGECIHKSWQCDGDPDCTDSSDESDQCVYSCREDQFMCNNHVCISNVLRCDGNDDCIDSSDEQNCTKPCDKLGEFDCYGDGSRCIPNDRVCDGRNDCQHREDEDSALCKHKNPCLTQSPTCTRDSHCVNKAYPNNTMDAQCVCNSGFNASEPGLCKDIDECDEPDVCSQICINTRGGYKCECHPGYQIEKHYFCRASGEQPWLYYVNRRDIRRLRTDSRYMEIIVSDTTNSIALDIDYEDGLLFWTDGGLEQIVRAEVDGDGVVATNQTTVISNEKDGLALSPDGLAVDWLYKKIYWTDTGSDTIGVADYRGDKMKTLINTDLDDPRAISVDPENGYMYWTDWGHSPKIERSGMDGNNRETIVHGGDDLQWPNGITIDYISKRIYWIDSKLHKIGVANMDGSKQGHVLVDATEIRRPFSISVFEDSLYWTDWHTNSIRSVHKVTGRNAKTLSLGSYSVMDIKVYHELRQSKLFKEQATALCTNANCEFMCLPVARISGNSTVSCICADSQMLNSDKRTCATAPLSSTPKPITKQPTITTGRPEVTTEKPVETSTVPAPTSEEGMGDIAVITAAIAGIVLITLFTAGCLIFRRYQSKNKKSMNFDNPVYRKTTTSDDHCIIRNDEPHLEPLTAHHENV